MVRFNSIPFNIPPCKGQILSNLIHAFLSNDHVSDFQVPVQNLSTFYIKGYKERMQVI